MRFKYLVSFFLFVSFIGNAQVPSPTETLGFEVGSDFHLATYEQSVAYLKKLEAASDILKVIQVGKTSEGRDWYFALISSKENLANIDKIKEITKRLAHPDNLTIEEAKQLANQGKPIVHIDGGLHATEVAGPNHTISLVYDIVSQAGTPKIKNILDNVVLMLWPTINPDGMTMVADWYHSNVGTPYEIAPIPKLYQKYVGHDNNRDAYALNTIESRVMERTWREWEPNIIYVHHQSSPFPTRIWLPPFAEPITPQTPPIIAREVNMIGMAIAQALEINNQPGATHMGTGFDAWYPGYIDYLPVLQNTPSYWTETSLYRYATPHFYTIDDYPKDKTDLRAEALYLSPWKGGWWRISDAMGYMKTASLATLDYAAKFGYELLYGRYQSAVQVKERYTKEPPYAYIIPQQQSDPMAAVEMLRRLAFNGVKIDQLNKSISINDMTFGRGTWIISMEQEYAELVRQVFDRQSYPDLREYPEGPPEQPYDAAGWTMPLQFDVRTIAIGSPLSDELKSAIDPIKAATVDWKNGDKDAYLGDFVPGVGFNTNAVAAGILAPAGRATGSGSNLMVDPKENNSFRVVNNALKAGGSVKASNGKYIISGVGRSNLETWVRDYSINAQWTSSSSGTTIRPKIGLYRPWRPSMDEGWTRWLLECFGFAYTNLTNADMAAGELNNRFDVIVLPADRQSILKEGFKKGSVPPQYEGGLEGEGIQQLEVFVRNGGTLVCLNEASDFAIDELHLPVKNVVKGVNRKEFFTGGSILEVEVNTEHPVMAGMKDRANVFVYNSPVFTSLPGFEGEALAKYKDQGSPLLSGYLLGEKHLNGFAAGMDVKYGQGHVVLMGFRPQWRGQPYGTFKILFNALMYGGSYSKSRATQDTFWKAPASTTEKGIK
ncbi:MAG: M14 family zinc carboxypeptidase [Cyclobacteriaceae bacterium]